MARWHGSKACSLAPGRIRVGAGLGGGLGEGGVGGGVLDGLPEGKGVGRGGGFRRRLGCDSDMTRMRDCDRTCAPK